MNKNGKIYIAGHNGMVGSAIYRKLLAEGYSNFVFRDINELDLRNQQQVGDFFKSEKPEYVILAAAKVGGINANNSFKADFIYDNLMIEANIIQASFANKVQKLLFLGSSCIYPKLAPQPIKEEYLLTGLLEPTNDAYAIAKIAGIQLCKAYREQHGCNYISVMPTNLYGPNDNFDLQHSHVMPAIIRKMVDAKLNNKPSVEIWGSGNPLREFLYVEDLADACYFLLLNYNEPDIVNIGTGEDISIRNLALLIKDIVGYNGSLTFNTQMPDGTPRKLLDVSKLHGLGWKHKTSLRDGITSVVENYMKSIK